MLRLKTLGGLSLWRGAGQITAVGAPPLALPFLAILGAAGDRSVAVDDVVALLWSDIPPDQGRRKIAALVSALPSWLEHDQPVHTEGSEMQLDAAIIASDVRDFEFAAASGAPDEAARLFTGAFLEGVTSEAKSFDRWREREAARLAQLNEWCRDATRPRRSTVVLAPGAHVGHGGRYRIERELGAGGAATVYLAHDSKHDRPVAMKVLRADISESINPERFEKEIRFVAQLQHPHILPLFDSGELGTVLYSVMPYVQGETVRQRLDRGSKIPVDDAVRIAAEVADALAYAHEHGVLHRDVKPENILLADGHALIADFGIARAVHAENAGRTTLPGVVLGTAAYMSPEQATGEDNIDGRTDVYALGAVLYEMLSGNPPFAGETARRTMTRRLTEVPPPVSKLGVHVPRAVDDALERALQPRPENRCTSREFASALSRAQRRLSQNTPVERAKRSRTALIASAVTVVTAIALLFAFRCARAQTPARSTIDGALLQQMLIAEDARGTGTTGIGPLLAGTRSTDISLRRVAIRALGRLQRPALVAELLPSLGDPVPSLRAEAANALAQSMQSLPHLDSGRDSSSAGRTEFLRVQSALVEQLQREPNSSVRGVLRRSLGRLPYTDSASARAAERVIVETLTASGAAADGFSRQPAGAAYDAAEGLYALARNRGTSGNLSPDALALLRAAVRFPADARVRRLGLLALGAAGSLDSQTVAAASHDTDAQVRRLSLAGVGALGGKARAEFIDRAFRDPSPMVRLDAIRAALTTPTMPLCGAIIARTHDVNPHVTLAAIDALASPCASSAARAAALLDIAGAPRGTTTTTAGHASWQPRAHAIVALAHADSLSASTALPQFSVHPLAHMREYAARAATVLGDAGTLYRLATDVDHNVQEAALAGLSVVVKHAADAGYISALGSRGYQVLLAASAALEGTAHPAAVPALLDALDRVTAERRENSRDPRMALLARIGELGTAANAPRLEPYRADFDTTVASKAADLLTKWSGRTVVSHAAPLAIREEPLAAVFSTGGLELRITMEESSGGGTMIVQLFPGEAPATVARILRLARAHYYDGLTIHRIVPNFVIQGGSPDATEYVGDGPFMRDELGLRSHDRGTLGISTRGRDTGDAQLFVNLVDNPRLDHEYTVFGRIISGLAIADGVLEGDVVKRVEVRGGR